MKKIPIAPAAALEQPEPRRKSRKRSSPIKPHLKGSANSRQTAPADPADPVTTMVEADATAVWFQKTQSSGPVLGNVRLETSTMTNQVVLSWLVTVDDGLTDNTYYEDAYPPAVRTAITTARSTLTTGLVDLANAEAYVRSLRTGLEVIANDGRNVLRTAAFTCESIDRRDEALLSVGWNLRRTPGRPRAVETPVNLSVKNTRFAGGVQARWRTVSNASFYEYQIAVGVANPDNINWELLPVVACRNVSVNLTGQPEGEFISMHVRAVGAKGNSPWTTAVTLKIN